MKAITFSPLAVVLLLAGCLAPGGHSSFEQLRAEYRADQAELESAEDLKDLEDSREPLYQYGQDGRR